MRVGDKVREGVGDLDVVDPEILVGIKCIDTDLAVVFEIDGQAAGDIGNLGISLLFDGNSPNRPGYCTRP